MLAYAWADQSENQYFICHKLSSVLYDKYSSYSGLKIQYSYFNYGLHKQP